MLTSVEVSGVRPSLDPLELLIAGSADSPIQIKEITGLEPVNAAITSSEYSNMEGEAPGGVSVGKRNIVFTFGLNPDWATQTMEELRQELYKYFMPKLDVRLDFFSTHLPDVYIWGVVESMIPNMFSADPEIQVSILCLLPDFLAAAETVVASSVVNGTRTIDIEYAGTKPCGVVVKIDTNPANVSYTGNLNFDMTWVNTDEFDINGVTIDGTYYFELSTVPGDKYVRKVTVANPAVYTSLLNLVVGVPDWFMLYPGDNEFKLVATETGQDLFITYRARYGGL